MLLRLMVIRIPQLIKKKKKKKKIYLVAFELASISSENLGINS